MVRQRKHLTATPGSGMVLKNEP